MSAPISVQTKLIPTKSKADWLNVAKWGRVHKTSKKWWKSMQSERRRRRGKDGNIIGSSAWFRLVMWLTTSGYFRHLERERARRGNQKGQSKKPSVNENLRGWWRVSYVRLWTWPFIIHSDDTLILIKQKGIEKSVFVCWHLRLALKTGMRRLMLLPMTHVDTKRNRLTNDKELA